MINPTRLIIIFIFVLDSIGSIGQSLERRNTGRWTHDESRLNDSSDSLNFWKQETRLPLFISDPNLDNANGFLGGTKIVEKNSFRKALLDRVVKKEILKAIIQSQNSDFDKLYDPVYERKMHPDTMRGYHHFFGYPDYNYMTFTTRILAKRRLQELEKSKIRDLIVDETGCWIKNDRFINVMTDSLNFWISSTSFPKFILDPSFDLRQRDFPKQCLKDAAIFISYRKAVFDRVVNDITLTAIVESTNPLLDQKYIPREFMKKDSLNSSQYPDIPYMKYSNRELAEMRLKVIKSITSNSKK